ncbi:MAG: hypothetical protein AAFV98_23340 [Chloroflexota bacterium]
MYNEDVSFVYLNATMDGADIYDALSLRGHPAYVIILPDGTEVFRLLGAQEETTLSDAIEDALQNEIPPPSDN